MDSTTLAGCVITAVAVAGVVIIRWTRAEKNARLPRGFRPVTGTPVKRAEGEDCLRDGYSKRKVPADLDCIVIGSGIGGMTTAALLARTGQKVLVLEQHYIAGGCTHTFDDHGYEFDTGVHYVGNIAKRKPILDIMTENEVEWSQLGREDPERMVYDEIVIGKEKYDFRTGVNNLIDDLSERFPGKRSQIEAYVELVKKVSQKGQYFNLKIIRPVWLRNLLRPLLCKEFFKYASRDAYSVVREIVDDEELISVLFGQFGDYGPTPKNASFFMHASVANHYFEGGFYPVNGTGQIAAQMVPTIERAGGRVLVRKAVKRVVLEAGRAVGVEMENGDVIRARTVVSAVGVSNTYTKLLEPEHGERFGLQALQSKVPPSVSYFFLFVGIKGNVRELGLRSSNIWILPEGDYDAMYEKYLADPLTAPMPMFMGFPCAKDSSWERRFPDKSTAIVLTTTKYEWFKQWEEERCMHRGEEYKDKKEKFAQRLLEEGLFKYYPQLRDKVDYYTTGSPLTNSFYLGAPQGECYGLDCPPARFTDKDAMQLVPETDIPNFYLTGQDICTLGFTGAMMGGVLTAHSILGYGGVADIISGRNLIEDIIHSQGGASSKENKME